MESSGPAPSAFKRQVGAQEIFFDQAFHRNKAKFAEPHCALTQPDFEAEAKAGRRLPVGTTAKSWAPGERPPKS